MTDAGPLAMIPAEIARRAVPFLGLTELSDACSEAAVDALCARALRPPGPVAAVCVWPRHVGRARRRLGAAPMRIATVVNFPAGGEDIERAVEDAAEALRDGADEIDLVLPYRALLRGDERTARALVEAVREVVDGDRLLKVILETGELGRPETIRAASRLALAAGADFLKTSTGKSPVSATPEAVALMLETIRHEAGGRTVGIKPSGGLRTVADAAAYLALADRIMGPAWVSPRTFRFGASTLLDALRAALEPAP